MQLHRYSAEIVGSISTDLVDGRPVVDDFLIASLLNPQAFNMSSNHGDAHKYSGVGVCITPSYVGSDCCCRDIVMGDEILAMYFPPYTPVAERQELLMEMHNIACTCQPCERELAETHDDSREKIAILPATAYWERGLKRQARSWKALAVKALDIKEGHIAFVQGGAIPYMNQITDDDIFRVFVYTTEMPLPVLSYSPLFRRWGNDLGYETLAGTLSRVVEKECVGVTVMLKTGAGRCTALDRSCTSSGWEKLVRVKRLAGTFGSIQDLHFE
ncbi:hypothetical protein BD410DRAFT_808068 [Rickenella mellea]|uniref:SET domain-containing protein n=1 Tax=Rickenella mellea TaxID=50990 RepID=A0A4Y7PNA3_9AGAM|nr:hypothetical protein BD410DRAFT_808068 [Rickenella mellea]